MKKIAFVVGLFALLFSVNIFAQEELSPYFKVGEVKKPIKEVGTQLVEAITESGWDVIGEYNPADKKDMAVICFTSESLKSLSLQFKDRGALASVLKVAMIHKDGLTTISILNPEYMFLAYWGEQLDGQEKELKEMSQKAINIFKSFGMSEPFGGMVEAKDLPDYHYMMMMPYFDEPVELTEFDSFEQGVSTIKSNLESKKGNTVLVYEQRFEGKEMAVFGIGLLDKETGEPNFLPIIGEDHIANLPYEIILEGKNATMLHGKYRIAIYWPELKMGQFMKISSTPGDIEDTFKAIVGEED